ncbi:MAG: hypothetical protein JOY78_00245 [Pseudonocardia sp.]|nr:hypothetical protein [Pseudonocardia sp.]
MSAKLAIAIAGWALVVVMRVRWTHEPVHEPAWWIGVVATGIVAGMAGWLTHDGWSKRRRVRHRAARR